MIEVYTPTESDLEEVFMKLQDLKGEEPRMSCSLNCLVIHKEDIQDEDDSTSGAFSDSTERR